MQEKQSNPAAPGRTPTGELIQVPPEYWDAFLKRDIDKICQDSLATRHAPHGLQIRFLNDDVLVDVRNRCICKRVDGAWEKINYALMELVILVYLLKVTPAKLAQELISVKDLKDAHFFQGPHALKVQPVLERYGDDLAGFRQAAQKLDGQPLDMADAAYRLSPLPKTPLFYLLWEGDEEFKPHLSILFDRSIELHLSADAIWGLVILVSNALLTGE